MKWYVSRMLMLTTTSLMIAAPGNVCNAAKRARPVLSIYLVVTFVPSRGVSKHSIGIVLDGMGDDADVEEEVVQRSTAIAEPPRRVYNEDPAAVFGRAQTKQGSDMSEAARAASMKKNASASADDEETTDIGFDPLPESKLMDELAFGEWYGEMAFVGALSQQRTGFTEISRGRSLRTDSATPMAP